MISTEVSADLQEFWSSDSPSELYQSEGKRRVFVSTHQLITGHGMALTLAVPYGQLDSQIAVSQQLRFPACGEWVHWP